jgi:hypothetical protein
MRTKTRIARALDCLLTPEQYARVKHPTPYLYTLGEGDNALCFVGAQHSTDPAHEQFSAIAEAFATQQPDIVLVEGTQGLSGVASTDRFIRQLDFETAIRRGGESIFTVRHALERNVPWQCPEPTDQALMRHLLLELYTPDQLVAWYTLRILGQYHRREETMPFVGYVSPFLSYLAQATGWSPEQCSLEQALATAATVLGHSPNIYNRERAEEYTDPIPWPNRWETQSRFNEITRAAIQYRDRTIVKRVTHQLAAGRRTLVVYGAGHAVMQEPAYRFFYGVV